MELPKQETIVLSYISNGEKTYTVTRNIVGKYTLYKIINDDYKKIKTGSNPLDFDKIINKERGKI